MQLKKSKPFYLQRSFVQKLEIVCFIQQHFVNRNPSENDIRLEISLQDKHKILQIINQKN